MVTYILKHGSMHGKSSIEFYMCSSTYLKLAVLNPVSMMVSKGNMFLF